MKRYLMHVSFSKSLDVDVDKGPDVTDEEFQIYIQAIELLISKFAENNQFRVVDKSYTSDFKDYFTKEFNKLGKVANVDWLSDTELIFAIWL